MIARMRQPGDQVQPAQVHERQLLLGRLLIAFCDQVSCLVKEGKAVDVIYLDFRKAFGSVSHSTLLEKLQLMACTGVLFAG